MMLFVMAYCNENEFTRFQFILDHWEQLVEMKSPFKFLFVTSIDKKLTTHYEHSFFNYKESPEIKNYEQQITLEWSKIAKYIADNIDCKYWFWWEWDVVPVKKDCFEFFIGFWTEQCQIMGYRAKDNMWGMRNKINGVAIYSKNYWKYIEPYFNLKGTFDTRKSFSKRTEKNVFVELNKWYCLRHHEGSLMLTPNIRIVHGIKDYSLLDQILGVANKYVMTSDFSRTIKNMQKIFYLNFISKYVYKIKNVQDIFRLALKDFTYWLIAKRCKIILCAGMARSGSTWLVNAARLLLSNSYKDTSVFWIEDFSPKKFLFKLRPAKILLLKVHGYDKIIVKHSYLVLYSIRDIRDVVASRHRMWGYDWEAAIKDAKMDITSIYPKYKSDADYIMRYEEMITFSEKVLSELAKCLKVSSYDCNYILSEIDKMNYFSSNNVTEMYNRENLLHKHHITDGRYGSWKDTIPEAYIKLIEDNFSEWLRQNNYPIDKRQV